MKVLLCFIAISLASAAHLRQLAPAPETATLVQPELIQVHTQATLEKEIHELELNSFGQAMIQDITKEFKSGKGVIEVETLLAQKGSEIYDEKEKNEVFWGNYQEQFNQNLLDLNTKQTLVMVQTHGNKHKINQLNSQIQELQNEIPAFERAIDSVANQIDEYTQLREQDVQDFNLRQGQERNTMAFLEDLIDDLETMLRDGIEAGSEEEFLMLLQTKNQALHEKVKLLKTVNPTVAHLIQLTAKFDHDQLQQVIDSLHDVKGAVEMALAADQDVENMAQDAYEATLADMRKTKADLEDDLEEARTNLAELENKLKAAQGVQDSLEDTNQGLSDATNDLNEDLELQQKKQEQFSKDWEEHVKLSNRIREAVNTYGDDMRKTLLSRNQNAQKN